MELLANKIMYLHHLYEEQEYFKNICPTHKDEVEKEIKKLEQEIDYLLSTSGFSDEFIERIYSYLDISNHNDANIITITKNKTIFKYKKRGNYDDE